MASVDVGADTYENIYADVDAADLYLGAAFHADSWATLDDDTKGRALITATRTLDRQRWLDAYNTYELRVAVPAIVAGCIELALAIVDGSEVQNNQNTSERVRSITAGSVSITNFRGVDDFATRFPLIVQELLGPYLGSSSGLLAAIATGVDTESVFPVELGFNGGL